MGSKEINLTSPRPQNSCGHLAVSPPGSQPGQPLKLISLLAYFSDLKYNLLMFFVPFKR